MWTRLGHLSYENGFFITLITILRQVIRRGVNTTT